MPSLQYKLERSRSFLSEILEKYGTETVTVAWTGGKDSTVALALWREILQGAGVTQSPKVINLDTGYKFPEVLAFRDLWADRWNLDLTIVHPDPAEVPSHIAEDTLACCKALKIDPLRRALAARGVGVLISGVRADEHTARGAANLLVAKHDPDYLQANPVLDWTEMDIWAYMNQAELPYCELYDKGYRSIGCVPCTRAGVAGDERAGRDQRKESQMGTLRALGYF